MSEFYYRSGPNEFGPLTSNELRRLAQAGRLVADDEVRKGRHGKWLPALKLPGLFSITGRRDVALPLELCRIRQHESTRPFRLVR